jgi:putative membrane protein
LLHDEIRVKGVGINFERKTSQMILRLIINAVALLIVAHAVPGIRIASLPSALVVALVLGIVNAILRPILILVSLPLEIVTLGLFTFVINGALFLLVAHFELGLQVDGFGAAIIGAVALSIVSFLLSFLVGAVERG